MITQDTITQVLAVIFLYITYAGIVGGTLYAIVKLIKNKIEYLHRHNGGVRSWRTRSRREIVRVHATYKRPVSEVRHIPYSECGQVKSYITIID